MNFSGAFFMTQVMPQLIAAIPITLELTAIAAIGSAVFGVPLALALGARAWLRWPAQAYSLVIRGTPMLVQIYFIYYGLGSLIPGRWMRHSWASPYLRDAFWYGVAALIINETAYVAVILRGGLDGVPKGEREAAAALGLSPVTTFFRIVLPRALMITLPTFGSELILLLKSTVLVSTITIFDVLGEADVIRYQTLRVLEPLLGAAVVYVVLVGAISLVVMAIEAWLARMR
ncbi:ABC transporter permease subunit [Acidisoma cellulosilytica]|uniref:ABC transporter permease subunit n=1 Tax=Acidisoma cellulosilyticum TaxID=2802395 RepID=A0A963Z4D9_9PROT|nr:ABC transporter permease subunit [Acidisoma cellulosilyticum]MCB8881543.1 ABC transporter permease subunit [Acidisoma cellulosilyticum]